MKRPTSRPLVRQPRGLQPASQSPASPFRSHLPSPAQRREVQNADLGKRVAAVITLVLAIACAITFFSYRASRTLSRSLDLAKRTAQVFASDLVARDYWNAAKQLSPSAERLHPPPAIKQEISQLELHNGSIFNATLAAAEPRSVAGLQTCRIDYTLTCEHAVVPLHLVLVQSYRHWSIESYTFG